MWMLGIQPGSTGRGTSPLNHQTLCPVTTVTCLMSDHRNCSLWPFVQANEARPRPPSLGNQLRRDTGVTRPAVTQQFLIAYYCTITVSSESA